MNPQSEYDQAEASAFVAGDVVQLVNVRSGLPVVAVTRRGGGRLYTPNPTRARIIAGPRATTDWTSVYDVRLLDGPYRGKFVSCHPAVLRLIERPDRAGGPDPQPETAPPKRWSFRGLLKR